MDTHQCARMRKLLKIMPAPSKNVLRSRTPASKQHLKAMVVLNTSIPHDLNEALTAYAIDKGLLTPQDVLRVAGTLMMKREGYLK